MAANDCQQIYDRDIYPESPASGAPKSHASQDRIAIMPRVRNYASDDFMFHSKASCVLFIRLSLRH